MSLATTAMDSRVTSYWGGVWLRFRRNKPAMAGLVIIGLLVLMALAGPLLTGRTYYQQNLHLANQPPSAQYWFGTDSLGRDLFTRTWYGARISLAVGLAAAFLSLVIGVAYGGISGYIGGRLDDVMMRLVEVLSGIPFLLWVILLMVLLEPGLKTVFVALGATTWLGMARMVRGQVMALKEQDYVLAARVLGAGPWRVLTRHLAPNTAGPIIVTLTLMIPENIATEALLSFLGLGVAVPMASWGVMARDGMEALASYPWQLLWPALSLAGTVFAFNLVGDGLRDAMDPGWRQ